jgi:hypothetical protein
MPAAAEQNTTSIQENSDPTFLTLNLKKYQPDTSRGDFIYG